MRSRHASGQLAMVFASSLLQVLLASHSHASFIDVVAPRSYVLHPLSTDSFALYVPSTMGLATPLSATERARVVSAFARMLAELAGGCTAQEATGFFVAANKQLVQEVSVTLLTARISNSSMFHELLTRVGVVVPADSLSLLPSCRRFCR